MGASRSLKRGSSWNLVIGLLFLLGVFYYLIQPSSRTNSRKSASEHPDGNVHGPPRKAPQIQHYTMNNLTATATPLENNEKVLILTPLARFYDGYWDNLLKLKYPRHLIELGFITPTTREGSLATTKINNAVTRVQKWGKKHRFAKVTILRQDFVSPGGQTEKERHSMSHQKARRSAMSQARNSLLFTTLNPTISWVLWLDSDIVETPHTLIQDLASHDKDVIVPNCWQRYKENGVSKVRAYDFNSWRDSEVALKLAEKMHPDDILLEGYAEMATYRSLMAYEYDVKGDKDKIVLLDGVGGTALMVKASVHRDGAMFPPFAFYHLIETEGFAKMARRLGYQPYGLPNYLVYHYNE